MIEKLFGSIIVAVGYSIIGVLMTAVVIVCIAWAVFFWRVIFSLF